MGAPKKAPIFHSDWVEKAKIMYEFKRIALKIGSNVLTRKDGTLDVTRMSALVDQVAELRKAGVEVIMVSSGAVASGRSELKNAQKLDSVSARQLYSAVGQAKLIMHYFELFRDYGITCGQVLTTKESLGTRGHYLNQKNCMTVMLENGVIPIVNENDTISVTELMFTDNDELSGLVATMMGVDALIILSNIDGIYNGHPDDPSCEVIRRVESGRRSELTDYIQKSRSGFGRGGMQTKYHIARKVADEGVTVIIANGKRENILIDLLRKGSDRVSTRFLPSAKAVSGVKKWIAHSDGFAKGELHINSCAFKVMTGEKAASLLPVGVVAVTGEFEKDDIVRIMYDDNQIGVGKTAFNSEKARSLAGIQGAKPLVHYDYLYLFEN